MYTDGLLGFFVGLSSSAKDMVMYIASRLPYNQDYLELTEERYCAAMQVSRRTYFNARQQLENRIIIERVTRKGTYWINPAYLFKGNRMTMYPWAVKMDNAHPFEGTPPPNMIAVPRDISAANDYGAWD